MGAGAGGPQVPSPWTGQRWEEAGLLRGSGFLPPTVQGTGRNLKETEIFVVGLLLIGLVIDRVGDDFWGMAPPERGAHLHLETGVVSAFKVGPRDREEWMNSALSWASSVWSRRTAQWVSPFRTTRWTLAFPKAKGMASAVLPAAVQEGLPLICWLMGGETLLGVSVSQSLSFSFALCILSIWGFSSPKHSWGANWGGERGPVSGRSIASDVTRGDRVG